LAVGVVSRVPAAGESTGAAGCVADASKRGTAVHSGTIELTPAGAVFSELELVA
jgi:hypothetical protein